MNSRRLHTMPLPRRFMLRMKWSRTRVLFWLLLFGVFVIQLRLALKALSERDLAVHNTLLEDSKTLSGNGTLPKRKDRGGGGSVKHPTALLKQRMNAQRQVRVEKRPKAKRIKQLETPIKGDKKRSQKDDPLAPIRRQKILYSIGRNDRSGSAITDMLYAHAFAYHLNVTYGGACWTRKGYPKADTRHLLQQLQWEELLPAACPPGAKTPDHLRPMASEVSELAVEASLYRDLPLNQLHFTPAWRREIAKYSQESSTITSKNKKYEIAVHVRRGDVTPCRYKRRYLPNSHYLKLIEQHAPKDIPYHVTIYSESDTYESFTVFTERGYDLELDTKDLAVVWRALSTADMVILSRSFFSFVPAAINPNTVIATPFFGFEPLEHWIQADEQIVRESDVEIRQMFDDTCNKTAIELERRLQAEKHGRKRRAVPIADEG